VSPEQADALAAVAHLFRQQDTLRARLEAVERSSAAAIDRARAAGVEWDALAAVMGQNSKSGAYQWRQRRGAVAS
jgi:hypothetical protein